MKKTRILIVDDHAILRMGLTSLLESESDLEVVGDAEDGKAALEAAERLRPDVTVMDLMMPDMDGAEAVRRLRAKDPAAKVMILTSFGTADALARALAAGASGAALKNTAFPDLVAALRTVAAGGRSVSPEIERLLEINPPLPDLSPRQREILAALVRGLSNADIAVLLGISADVVKEHVSNLCEKIGAANRTEAVAIALRRRLCESD